MFSRIGKNITRSTSHRNQRHVRCPSVGMNLFSNWPDTSNDFVPDDILKFWFGEITSRHTPIESHIAGQWFLGDKEFDNLIINKFGGFMHVILDQSNDLHKIWLSTLRGTVSYIVIADQFARNVYRGTPKAFENDEYAQNVVNACIQSGKDRKIFALHPAFNAFLYMPLMHSEDLKDHDTLSECQRWMLDTLEKEHPFYGFLQEQSKYASHHRKIVEKFGRFPHRNEILRRESTEEEMQYIKDQTFF